MAAKAWKPDGPVGMGGVRVRTLCNSRYSIGEWREWELQTLKLLKRGEEGGVIAGSERRIRMQCYNLDIFLDIRGNLP